MKKKHILRYSSFIIGFFVMIIMMLRLVPTVQANIFGDVVPSQGVQKINDQSGGEIGLLFFFSRVVQFIVIAAGIASTFNFIIAGVIFITSAGDTGAYAKVKDKLTYGIIGLVIVATSFTLAGLIGLVFFGNAGFILSPELYVIEPTAPTCTSLPC